jgi:glyoxylase-like metal-dependent hydrolase (beta-lactamase superfamily II)
MLALLVSALLPWPPATMAAAIEASYRQARNLISQSLEQGQNLPWLQQPGPLLVATRGTMNLTTGHLGHQPGSDSSAPYRETWAWDPASGALGREYRLMHPDGTDEWIREVFPTPDELWRIDLGTGSALHFHGPEQTARRDRVLRRFTPLLLTEALDQAAALRFTGRFGPFDSIQMQTHENESLSLFFGRESRQLGWVEYLTDLPTFGDSTVAWRFSDYRPVAGIGIVPHGINVQVNDAGYADLAVVSISQSAEEVSAFLAVEKLPERQSADNPEPRVERLADGVFRIADIALDTHMLAVEFDDGLLVVDAPAARPMLNELPASLVAPTHGPKAISEQALGLLLQAIPGKPVRHLLLSHFHSDSAGGLMAFSHAGVELITSVAQAALVRDYLQHSHTLQGGEAKAENFQLRPISDRYTLRDRSQWVEILQIGPNPHSQEMLVAWLPHSGILWVADLQRAIAGGPDTAQHDLNRFFDHWLTQQRIEPNLILTAHGDGIIYPRDRSRGDTKQTRHLPRKP